MSRLKFLPMTALLLAGGCAYDGQAQGYDPNYPPPPYDQGGPPPQAYDQGGVPFGESDVPSIEVFFDQLAPFGRWVDSRYGRVWSPNVGRDWRPYTVGRWGQDRYWISDEPFGWAVYHYGRWAFDPDQGWLWVPGTQWAPSWVAWRDADDYAGWAPLPPGISVSVGIGFGVGYDNYDSWYQPSWVWVPRNYIYQPRFGGHIVDWRIGGRIWTRSRWEPRPEWHGRPGGGRPDGNTGRPGWNGGNNGNRPGWNGQRPDGNRPDGNRPGWNGGPNGGVRPDQPRPDQPRPDGNRPGWNGQRPGTVTPQPGQPGTPYPGYRPGRPADTPPPNPAAWQGRPNRSPNLGGGQPGATMPVPQPRPAFNPAMNARPAVPVVAPVPQARPAPPPPQQARPAPPPRENGRQEHKRDEKPQ